MSVAVAIITLVLLAVVVIVISAPLRSPRRVPLETAERAELEAARLAKYREIRDAELDYRTGKLSREDHERLAASLRAEAAAILEPLEALGGDVADAPALPVTPRDASAARSRSRRRGPRRRSSSG